MAGHLRRMRRGTRGRGARAILDVQTLQPLSIDLQDYRIANAVS